MTWHLRRDGETVTWRIGAIRDGAAWELTFTTPDGPLVFQRFEGYREAHQCWDQIRQVLAFRGWQTIGTTPSSGITFLS